MVPHTEERMTECSPDPLIDLPPADQPSASSEGFYPEATTASSVMGLINGEDTCNQWPGASLVMDPAEPSIGTKYSMKSVGVLFRSCSFFSFPHYNATFDNEIGTVDEVILPSTVSEDDQSLLSLEPY